MKIAQNFFAGHLRSTVEAGKYISTDTGIDAVGINLVIYLKKSIYIKIYITFQDITFLAEYFCISLHLFVC